jgi:transposase-like protein
VFHRSKVPLPKWFFAIFLNSHSKRGISALELSKQIGVHRETAWTMLHKLRQAMADRDRLYTLDGIVDLDDAFFGGVKHGKVGRGTTRVKAVVAVSMDDNEHPQHAKILVVDSWTQSDVNAVAKAIIEPGSTIRTDGMGGFGTLSDAGFEHDIIPSNKLAEDVSPFPDIHMLISNARAWILGTFHGLGPKYMETYPAEFIYRFNRRHLEHRLFDRLVSACLWAPHMTVMDIVVV